MSDGEGELHKKIREKAREDYHCDLGKVVDCLLVKADFFEVLTEAKQDFPDVDEMRFKVVGIDEWPPEDPKLATDLDAYLKKLNEWFVRWFGKEETK